MFTGIIETMGIVREVSASGSNKTFWIESAISAELKADQSVSHDGACLTVEETGNNSHRVTAIKETLGKTSLGHWKKGDLVNLERCLLMNGRIDGHIVQGHVDTIATCTRTKTWHGSHELTFEFPKKFNRLVIEKGSISLNGTSLTVFDVAEKKFSVAIIPYTFEHTNIKNIKKGTVVNIEFDMIGKYVAKLAKQK
ncbi:MAG: riboflavin synthase [Bacteroidetes bacterium]|nr:riboflavin synthase [Bacteroidota bacterium]MBS1974344.1 riboflavin synthase [Bacteroidota bacterium]